MTPEAPPLSALPDVMVQGAWGGRSVRGPGTLVVHRGKGEVVAGEDQVDVVWRQLSDAVFERGILSLHRGTDQLTMTGPGDLPRVWGIIVEQACPMPEFARGLRALGRRGGDGELQARFFAPLIAARRRVADPDTVERRVGQFDGAALARRWTTDVAQFAALRHPTDAPRRRALEAHLEEALEPCLVALDNLQAESAAVHAAVAGTRFLAWRRWTGTLHRVFIEADRTWHHVSLHLP
jgi:hypothetical protein